MAKVFKITRRSGAKSATYYGKIKTGPGTWQKVKLYTDKTASARRLADLQREADQRDAGYRTPDVEVLSHPITELRTRYIATLKQQRRNPQHVRITDFMLGKLIELGGWRYYRDITRESVERLCEKLDAAGKTVAYRNKFITRAKAFVHHWLPDGWPDPPAKAQANQREGRQANARAPRRLGYPAQRPAHL